MGVNNKQRRAAKQRERARRAAGHHRSGGTDPGSDRAREPSAEHGGGSEPWAPYAASRPGPDPEAAGLVRAEAAVRAAVSRLLGRGGEGAEREARFHAQALLVHSRPPLQPEHVGRCAAELGHSAWCSATAGGWAADDLEELVRRRAGEQHLATLDGLRPAAGAVVGTPALASVLRVTALLLQVPVGRPSSGHAAPPARTGVSQETAKKLATVRGLLAKAERTSFDEEAEALSAKAQQLISRHALERLLAEAPTKGQAGSTVGTGRVWLENPYLMAKASLVNAVADANRCRCVVSESLGLCSLVGDPVDLDAVQLLSTSLMVQANRSMLRHGRQVDRRGVSRTRSFRQSFLVAFAHRIGQRLAEVDDDAVREAAAGTDLVPVLRARQQQVDQTFEALFPDVVHTGTSVTNGQGWAAGRAAADDARLELDAQLPVGVAAP